MACRNCQNNTNQSCPCQNQGNTSSCGCSNCNAGNSCSQKKLLKEIMALNFAINDLALYLDTHPNDTNAIRMHCEYSEKQIAKAAEYQRLYGPLTINFMSDTWDWIDEPWPWERGAY